MQSKHPPVLLPGTDVSTCLHWQSSVLSGQAGALWLCKHPVCSFPSDCTALQASTELMEQGDNGIGSSLMAIQKCTRSWAGQSAASSTSHQRAAGLSRENLTLSAASRKLTKAVPGQGTSAVGHWWWLCCRITLGMKDSQAPVSSHFTCGPWQAPAGCTARCHARQGARRKNRRDRLQQCLSSPGMGGTGDEAHRHAHTHTQTHECPAYLVELLIGNQVLPVRS